MRAGEGDSLILKKEHLNSDLSDEPCDRLTETLNMFSSHHKILYKLTHSHNPIHSTKLENKYRQYVNLKALSLFHPEQ